MICPRADGSETEVTFLRSPAWIRESIRLASGDVIAVVDARLIGRSIEIVIPEIALSGMARIVAVDDCPGEIVTGTFATNRAAALDLEFSGLPDTLGVTAEHPIWSETRADFVPAGELEIGEEVLALNGETTKLSSITPRAGQEAVYNCACTRQGGLNCQNVPPTNGALECCVNSCTPHWGCVAPDTTPMGGYRLHER